MSLSSIPWDFALLLLVLAVLIPWRGAMRIRRVLQRDAVSSSQRLSLYASTMVSQWLLTALVLWRAFARGLTSSQLGLMVRNAGHTIEIAVALATLLGMNQFFSLRYLGRLPPDRDSFLFRFTEKVLPRGPLEFLFFAALSCTAGISEEIIYRGFVFAVMLRSFLTSSPVAVSATLVASSALFAIGHAYQGRRGVFTTFIVGLIFASARAWSASLVPPIVAHIAVDVVAGFSAPRMLKVAAQYSVSLLL